MKYLVLARRYRPQTFSDVIGQEAIITTLKNALRFERVAHAYLFCGSRGIGKTTVARLFAKALNCQALSTDHEPCNQCPSCLEILSGQSLDVIEIDGASNRGIDDIRQLNETIGYAPSHGKYKIYIIDEVHMLTKEAFNALLKTLEEPPERAKFFFATTEPHKVLPTIVSRCQRFDLQRIAQAEIARKLTAIAADLKREATAEAIHLITTFAEGSLRDAESLFDQILCFTDEQVRAEHVRNVLGLVPDELLFELDTAFSEGRAAFAFEMVDRLFQMGKDLGHFTEQLIGHYRRLTVAKTMGTASLHLPEPLLSHVIASTKLYTPSQLFHILETLLTGFAQLQRSSMQRVSLESILLQILRSKNRIPVEVLVRRLSELEQKLLDPAAPVSQPIHIPAPSSLPLEIKSAPTCHEEKIPQISPDKDARPQILATKAPEPIIENALPAAPPLEPPLEMKSVPFNPLLTRVEEKTANAPQIKPERAAAPSPAHEAGRYETLLRFAAVELEGTIKN
ncbi:MAG: dnaX [Parachlamydiales bacterium]|nr:dnaX [Parachlamydiales bacterium]